MIYTSTIGINCALQIANQIRTRTMTTSGDGPPLDEDRGRQIIERLAMSSMVLDNPLAEQMQSYPVLQDLLEWWYRLTPNGDMPSRMDVDPLSLPIRALPLVILVDVERPDLRYRVRLAGTALCAFVGRELRGSYLDEIFIPRDYDKLARDHLRMLDEKSVHFTERHMHTSDDRQLAYGRLAMPLSSDGVTVDAIFTGLEGEVFRH